MLGVAKIAESVRDLQMSSSANTRDLPESGQLRASAFTLFSPPRRGIDERKSVALKFGYILKIDNCLKCVAGQQTVAIGLI